MRKTDLNIYSYTEFRSFLNDRLLELKKQDRKFSRRFLSKKLDLANSNHLKLIIDGARNVSEELTQRLARVLGLNKEERLFFLDLVHYGQAKTTEAKADSFEKLRRNRHFMKVHQLTSDQFDYYADPLMLTLREIVALKDFQEDPEWIASRMPTKVTFEEIKKALSKLQRLGLLVRDSEGLLKLAHQHQRTGEQLGSTPLRTYHRKMLSLAAKALELPVEKRYYNGLTMAIKADMYPKLLELHAEFIDKVRSLIDEEEAYDDVYHLETTLFPLTRPGKVKKKKG